MMHIIHRLHGKIVALSDMRLLLVFSMLFVALFLGDGKQSFIDLFISIGFIGIYVWERLQHHRDVSDLSEKTSRKQDLGIWVLWGSTLLYLVVRTCWSDSISYSLTSINRFFVGFLVFSLFFSLGKDADMLKKYVYILFWFLVGSVLCSVIVSLFPVIGTALPLMNLLFPNYGHNSVSYLFIFLLPIVYEWYIQKSSWKTGIFAILTVILIFSTFARGVWILTGIYTLVFIGRRFRELSNSNKIVLFAVSLFFLTVFLGFFRINTGVHFNVKYASFFQRYVLKESVTDNRIQYWTQAMHAIRERPVFGSGPGTFFLQSERFQKTEGMYSWYAHNSVLQMMTELGILGSIPVLLLLVYTTVIAYRQIRRKRTTSVPYMSIILDGCVLTILYSLYDYTMDFFVIWVLLWAGLGILVGTSDTQGRTINIHRFFMRMTVIFILFFCVCFFGDYIQFLTTDTQKIPSFFIPVNGLTTKSYLKRASEKQISMSSFQRKLILLFHARDPEVRNFLGDTYGALQLEPLNTVYMRNVFLQDIHDSDVLAQFILTYTAIVQDVSADEKASIRQDIKSMMQFTDVNTLIVFIGEPDTAQEFLSKFYYYLGSAFLSIDPSKTRIYWTLARDLSPGWGYFHAELARLEYAYFHDAAQANNVLDNCKTYPSAFGQCNDVILDLLTSDDRNQYENIARIPNL